MEEKQESIKIREVYLISFTAVLKNIQLCNHFNIYFYPNSNKQFKIYCRKYTHMNKGMPVTKLYNQIKGISYTDPGHKM